MRLPALHSLPLAALSLCLLTGGPRTVSASPVSGKAITQLSPTAVRPQARALSKAICAPVTFTKRVALLGLLGVYRAEFNNFCVCATADAKLTADSIRRINDRLRETLLGAVFAALGDVGLSLLNVPVLEVETQEAALRQLELVRTPPCDYKTFVVPDSCTDCTSFTCMFGYTRCNDACVPTGQPCASSGARKRSLATRSKYICPLDETPCPVVRGTTKVSAVLDLKNVECVAIRHKLESCGGCLTPFPGGSQGHDCSQIPNAWDVACVAGDCVVDACAPGYKPTSDKAACEGVRPGVAQGERRRCLPGHCRRPAGPVVRPRPPAQDQAAWQAVSAAAAAAAAATPTMTISAATVGGAGSS